MNMHVLLREWDLNTGFLKSVIDGDREITPGEKKPIYV
jgi:hypothetical protein